MCSYELPKPELDMDPIPNVPATGIMFDIIFTVTMGGSETSAASNLKPPVGRPGIAPETFRFCFAHRARNPKMP